MPDLHRIDRRLFLSDLGRRTVAIAVVGPGVLAACSSNGSLSSLDGSESVPDEAPAPQQSSADLRWQRVVLGNVSAYVLARGTEISIVDSGRSGSAPDIERALDSLGATWGDVGRVILTHLHGDHVGGLPGVLEQTDRATVHAGRADVEGIRSSRPIEALDDGDEIFGLQVIATPGHTPGHIAVLDPVAGFLVAGDSLNESGGMVLGPNPDFSPDMTAANASVKRLAERSFETVVFGHGDPIEDGASEAVVALAQTLG